MDTTETPTPYGSPHEDRLLPGPSTLLARSLLYLVLLLVAAATIWASVTELDVVVNARGRLMVQGEPVEVTPPEPGLLVELPIAIGDRVEQDQLLLRLDAFKYGSEVDQIQGEILALNTEARSHREAAEQTRATATFVQRELDARVATTVIITEQLDRLRDLIAGQLAPVSAAHEKELELAEARAGIAARETELRQREDDAAERERQATEADARVEALAARLAQLSGFEQRLSVASPVAGTVTDLAVMHPGSVLDTTEPAVVILPEDRPLLAAIQIPNASMRRLHVGLPVHMRFDAYPYQDFGDLQGEIVQIEPDADEQGDFRAWVSLVGTSLDGPRGTAELGVGLQLDAEIVVDRRTVVDFLLKPIKRLAEPIRVAD